MTVRWLGLLSLASIAVVAGAAYFLTQDATQQDPCLNPQNDVSAAMLAADEDQDGLANRAMLQRKLCAQRGPSSPDK